MEKKPALPPPTDFKPPLDDCVCPSCKRSFKSARGVSQHRRIANCYADLDTPALETIIKEKIRIRPDVKLEVCIDIVSSWKCEMDSIIHHRGMFFPGHQSYSQFGSRCFGLQLQGDSRSEGRN